MLSIKRATVNDVKSLRQLSIQTFTETYTQYNTAEDMQLYNETYFNEERLLNEVSGDDNLFFLAYSGDVLAGYVKMRTTEQLEELNNRRHIEIERIYVLQQFQKQKIGLFLINHCIETSAQQGFDVIWLGVWEQNKKAIDFYMSRGFTIFGVHDFVLGTDKQKDWLMKYELKHQP